MKTLKQIRKSVHNKKNNKKALKIKPTSSLSMSLKSQAEPSAIKKIGKWVYSYLEEEAPVNSAGGGEIAGIGVGAKGEPGVSKKRQRKWQDANAKDQGMMRRGIRKLVPPIKEGCFAGKKTFKVSTSSILEVKVCKRKGAHWSKFLPENNIGEAIREWANANPNEPVILEDDIGNIVFVRYGNN